MQEADLPLVLAWRQDREVMRYLPSAPERPVWEEHFRWWKSRTLRIDWMVLLRAEGVANGYRPVGVVHCDLATGEIGIIIGEKGVWGKGVGRTALSLALAEATKMGKPPMWALIHPDNIGSQKIFEANGFVSTREIGRRGQLVFRLRSGGPGL